MIYPESQARFPDLGMVCPESEGRFSDPGMVCPGFQGRNSGPATVCPGLAAGFSDPVTTRPGFQAGFPDPEKSRTISVQPARHSRDTPCEPWAGRDGRAPPRPCSGSAGRQADAGWSVSEPQCACRRAVPSDRGPLRSRCRWSGHCSPLHVRPPPTRGVRRGCVRPWSRSSDSRSRSSRANGDSGRAPRTGSRGRTGWPSSESQSD